MMWEGTPKGAGVLYAWNMLVNTYQETTPNKISGTLRTIEAIKRGESYHGA